MLKSVCVYCGSSDRSRSEYLEAARALGHSLARRSIQLIYGAGRHGLMGAVADGVLESGGHVTGVMPAYLNTPLLCHQGLTCLEVVDTIHQRKARMAELAEAFIALPGGYGTFEEFFEILTWAQIGLHQKPIGLLNVYQYFDPLLSLVEHAWREGFIYTEHQTLFTQRAEPEALLDALATYVPEPGRNRWIDRAS